MIAPALVLAALAAAPAQDSAAAPEASTATALVHFADGNTLPLRNWTLSYAYVTWAQGRSPATGTPAERPARELWLGKRVLSLAGAQMAVEYAELRRETLVDGRPQPVLSSAARGVTVTAAAGRAVKAKVEPPHRDLLAPGADKSVNVLARSLDLRGDGVTGTRREVCLLSYTSLVDCGATPADQVVKVEFH